MDAALEKKIRDVVDRQEIWQVLQRYARGVDRCDRELLRSAYWPDGIEDHGGFLGTTGEFVDWVNGVVAQCVASTHGLLNHTCELAGDEAHCETYFMAVTIAAKAPHRMATGRYVDHFQRRDGEWRIANRVTVIEGRFELQDNAAALAMNATKAPDERRLSTHDRTDVSYSRPLRPRQPAAV